MSRLSDTSRHCLTQEGPVKFNELGEDGEAIVARRVRRIAEQAFWDRLLQDMSDASANSRESSASVTILTVLHDMRCAAKPYLAHIHTARPSTFKSYLASAIVISICLNVEIDFFAKPFLCLLIPTNPQKVQRLLFVSFAHPFDHSRVGMLHKSVPKSVLMEHSVTTPSTAAAVDHVMCFLTTPGWICHAGACCRVSSRSTVSRLLPL